MTVEFTVPGEPRAKRRPRFGQRHAYTPAVTLIAQAAVGWEGRRAMTRRKPFTGPLVVELRFYMKTSRRVDVDNLAKLALDALNGITWADDSQIASLHIEKTIDRAQPRTEIRIREAAEAAA